MSELFFYKLPSGNRTRAQICAKIDKIDEFIDLMSNTALLSADSANIAEYEIWTGQSKQRVEYTDANQVLKAIDVAEKLRQKYQNKLQSRTFKMVDQKNFRV